MYISPGELDEADKSDGLTNLIDLSLLWINLKLSSQQRSENGSIKLWAIIVQSLEACSQQLVGPNICIYSPTHSLDSGDMESVLTVIL